MLHFNLTNKKTELCYFWANGIRCPHKKCLFAHGEQELREPELNPKFKTQLCIHYWDDSGICIYGQKCSFVHEINKRCLGRIYSSDQKVVHISTRLTRPFRVLHKR